MMTLRKLTEQKTHDGTNHPQSHGHRQHQRSIGLLGVVIKVGLSQRVVHGIAHSQHKLGEKDQHQRHVGEEIVAALLRFANAAQLLGLGNADILQGIHDQVEQDC